MSVNDDALKQLIRKFREGKAIQNYLLVKDDKGLMRTGIDPDSIKRASGRPPLRMLVECSDDPKSVPTVIHEPIEIVQLVLKQKWQVGLSFSNNESEENKCFVAVAELFNGHPREIRRKYYTVNEEQRKEIEVWLVSILLEFGEIKATRMKQARELLGIENP